MLSRVSFVVFGLVALVGLGAGPCSTQTVVPGLSAEVRVVTDKDGVWHIEAENDFDLQIAQGFIHCRERLFQMDQTRRQVDGTEAELLGVGELGSDVQARIVGLHRAAQRSLDKPPSSSAFSPIE